MLLQQIRPLKQRFWLSTCPALYISLWSCTGTNNDIWIAARTGNYATNAICLKFCVYAFGLPTVT